MKAALLHSAWHTPLGTGKEVLARIAAGHCAAQSNPHVDASELANNSTCPLIASINYPAPASRQQRYLRRMGLFALDLAKQMATEMATKLVTPSLPNIAAERLGLFFGYGGLRVHWDDMMPAFAQQSLADVNGLSHQKCWQRGLHVLHPFWMLQHLSNNAHALAAQEIDAQGDGATYSGGNAGAQAIAGAIRALASHSIDRAIVVAYDSLLEPETLLELSTAGLCNHANLAELAAAYSGKARGYVPAEAAAALVLQRLEDSPGASISLQASASADGQNQLASADSLSTLAASLLAQANADENLGNLLWDGAGIAQTYYDQQEQQAMRQLAAQYDMSPSVQSCIASNFGQTGAAHSLLQTIALANFLQTQQIPPLAGIPTSAQTQVHGIFHTALGLSSAAPGLAAAIRLDLIGEG